MSSLFRWLLAVSSVSQLVGAALILWGLTVVAVPEERGFYVVWKGRATWVSCMRALSVEV
jgi:hypothetical protein